MTMQTLTRRGWCACADPFCPGCDEGQDAASLLATCPPPCTDADWAWEDERDEEMTREQQARLVEAEERRRDRLSQDAPWLSFDEEA